MPPLRRMIPSSHALFVFEAVARNVSFTQAATELNVTQPAVSKAISQLERHLGVRLFDRSSDGLALTEEGSLLFQRVTDGFQGIEAALREIDIRRTGTDTVTLSVSSAFATHWLMPRINTLQEAFPAVDFRFQLIPGALGGPVDSVDLGMRFVEGPDRDHEALFLMNEVMLPVCSPTYLAGSTAGGGRTTMVNLTATSPARTREVDPGPGWTGTRASLNFSDYAVVVQAALLGQGVALGWLNVVSHWLATGDLVPASERLTRTARVCQLVHLRARPLRASVAAVRDWIIAEMRADIAKADARYPDLGLERACFGAP
ncbi:transcriptional regulator, LysR family [Methylobacterium sp. 4-46]|uniref:LysR family transcriptional regulator n=1 Tax=unclassified Methylobacterium TaxID=2615210 RepID=UPI000152E21D|nr:MULTISPECIES: LysR family transcriptional regulator [Methylobacterium]ACA19843.1 transcriptional regulator, LysR family [Methylobacterium sp. 4-46]WFT79029.1 LysR family transcriptional regulator [Methylobacterium nodulans]